MVSGLELTQALSTCSARTRDSGLAFESNAKVRSPCSCDAVSRVGLAGSAYPFNFSVAIVRAGKESAFRSLTSCWYVESSRSAVALKTIGVAMHGGATAHTQMD